jgi:hypothetical protein
MQGEIYKKKKKKKSNINRGWWLEDTNKLQGANWSAEGCNRMLGG